MIGSGQCDRTVADRRIDHKPASAAGERVGAPSLELANAGRRVHGWARLHTVSVQQVPAIATLSRVGKMGVQTLDFFKCATDVTCRSWKK